MQDTTNRRLAVTRAHILPSFHNEQNSILTTDECKSFDSRTRPLSLPTTLSPQDVQTLLTDYVEDHTPLRRKVLDWFEQHREISIRSGLGDGDLETIRLRGHEQACTILQQKFITIRDILDDPTKVFAFFESLACDGSVNVKLSVHYNLFGACIAHLGTKKHHTKYFPDFEKGDHVGCFLMSELEHASNLRNLGTTITYNPDTQDFVVNTPNDGSQKYWIGNAFVSAKIGVIFGQLIVKNVNHGVHAFVIHIRDENHKLFPGIRVKDVGIKLGLNAVDNGRVWFDNYHIPIDALLDRYAQVDSLGQYKTSIKSNNFRFAKHIGALLQARIGVGCGSVVTSKLSLFIALRYAYKRKQFGPPGGDEVPLITYRIHQRRLIPLMATSFAITFFNNLCKREYARVSVAEDDEESLKQVHLLASATKAYCSWTALEHIQMAREATGGQGYLTRNIISIMLTDSNVFVTLDGDNYLLMQQISQVLLSHYAKSFNMSKGKNASKKSLYEAISGLPGVSVAKGMLHLGRETLSDVTRGGLIKNHMNVSDDYLTSSEFLLNCFQFRQDRLLHTMAKRLYSAVKTIRVEKPHLDRKLAGFEGYNQVQDHSLNLAKAYCENAITSEFFDVVQNMKNKLGEGHNIVRTMSAVCTLHALDRIEKHSSWFLESRAISRSQIKRIRGLINELCSDLVPVVPTLINAWGIEDDSFFLDETIASSKHSYVELNAYDREFSQ